MATFAVRSRFVSFVSLACYLVAGLVLLGWAIDAQILKSVLPGLVAMNPLTAILFGVAGTALAHLPRQSKKTVATLASLLLVFAAFRLAAYVFSWGFSPCQLLFTSKLAMETPPNRMAPNTAVAFFVVGASFLLLLGQTKKTIIVGQFLGLAVGLVGLVTVLGYATDDLRFVSVFGQIPMALHTGAMFALLGFGVALARRDVGPAAIFFGPSANSLGARRLLAAASVIVLATLFFRLWGQYSGLYGAEFGSASFAIVTILLLAFFIGLGTAKQQASDAATLAAQAESSRQAQFVRELIDAIPGLVFAKDEEGKFIFANKTTANAYGVTAADMVGKTDADFNPHQAQTDAFVQADHLVMSTGETLQMEEPLTDSDGIQRWLLTVKRAVPSPLADGKKVLLGISTDISDRKAVENQLRERSHELEDLYNRAPCGYHSLDPNGMYLRVNDTELAWLGRTREEVVGKIRFPELLTPESQAFFESQFPLFLKTGNVRDLEFEFIRKNGETFWVSLTASAVYDAQGQYVESRSTMFDITERRRAEAEAKLARQEAEQASDAKSEFLSRMSHELRTPLNAVLGHAQLLQLRGGNDRTLESADQIVRAGNHLLDLINEVLDLAKIEARRLSVSLEPIMVGDVVSQAIELVGNMAETKGIDISTNLSVCDETSAMADRQRTVQILINLVSNAIKYNRPGGKVDIQCSCSEDDLKVSVKDQGKGISSGDLHRLFQPFERLGEEVSEGTGLGLALSRRLAEAMGGRLELEESTENGSTFVLHLRTAPDDQQPSKRIDAVRANGLQASDSQGDAKVLYIEDNLANLKLIEAILQERGNTQLVSAMQGRIGLEIARSQRPNVILLDVHLPDINGRDVLRELRLDPITADTPIIMISADATSRQIKSSLEAGADAYLAKPIEVERLLRMLNEWQDRGWKRV